MAQPHKTSLHWTESSEHEHKCRMNSLHSSHHSMFRPNSRQNVPGTQQTEISRSTSHNARKVVRGGGTQHAWKGLLRWLHPFQQNHPTAMQVFRSTTKFSHDTRMQTTRESTSSHRGTHVTSWTEHNPAHEVTQTHRQRHRATRVTAWHHLGFPPKNFFEKLL
jgi:hypothetical protein